MALAWRDSRVEGWSDVRVALGSVAATPIRAARHGGRPRGRAADARGRRSRRRDARRRAQADRRRPLDRRLPAGRLRADPPSPAPGRRRLVTRAPATRRGHRRGRPAAGVRRGDGAAVRRRARVPVAARGGAAVRVGGGRSSDGRASSRMRCPKPLQVELVDAHPRLGAPPASVSAMSFREQGYDLEAAANLASDAARERDRVAAELDRLNREYEGAVRLPLLCLRGRSIRAPSSCPRWRRRSRGSAIRSSTARSTRSSTSPRRPLPDAVPTMTVRARREPLRQVADPARHGPPRARAPRPPRPDRRGRARGRVRRVSTPPATTPASSPPTR